MILTLALLIMIGCMFGLIILYRQLHHENISTTVRVSELKVLISGMRHELSLDRQGMDERFDSVDRHLERLGHRIGQDGTKTRQELAEAMDAQYEQHKKTRKDIQEVKTGDEWSKKRGREILDKLDELLKLHTDTVMVELPAPGTVVLKEGQTRTVNGVKITAATDTSINSGDIQDTRTQPATKNRRRKRKPSASK